MSDQSSNSWVRLRSLSRGLQTYLGQDILIRALSALVLIPAAIWIIWTGGLIFKLIVYAAGIRLLYEWNRLTLGTTLSGQGQGQGVLLSIQAATLAFMIMAWSAEGFSFAPFSFHQGAMATALIALAGLLVLGMATLIGKRGLLWPALGLAYVGLPTLGVIWLQDYGGVLYRL